MAVSGKAVIALDDIKDSDGTVKGALELWSTKQGPVTYNKWQSAYFQIVKLEGLTDAGAQEGETGAEKQARIRQLYDDVQTELYGEDHAAQG